MFQNEDTSKVYTRRSQVDAMDLVTVSTSELCPSASDHVSELEAIDVLPLRSCYLADQVVTVGICKNYF